MSFSLPDNIDDDSFDTAITGSTLQNERNSRIEDLPEEDHHMSTSNMDIIASNNLSGMPADLTTGGQTLNQTLHQNQQNIQNQNLQQTTIQNFFNTAAGSNHDEPFSALLRACPIKLDKIAALNADGTNFDIWDADFRRLIRMFPGCPIYLDPGALPREPGWNEDLADGVNTLIHWTIDKHLSLRLEQQSSNPCERYAYLNSQFSGQTYASRISLHYDLYHTMYDPSSSTIDGHIANMSAIRRKLERSGMLIGDDNFAAALANSMPTDFPNVTHTFETTIRTTPNALITTSNMTWALGAADIAHRKGKSGVPEGLSLAAKPSNSKYQIRCHFCKKKGHKEDVCRSKLKAERIKDRPNGSASNSDTRIVEPQFADIDFTGPAVAASTPLSGLVFTPTAGPISILYTPLCVLNFPRLYPDRIHPHPFHYPQSHFSSTQPNHSNSSSTCRTMENEDHGSQDHTREVTPTPPQQTPTDHNADQPGNAEDSSSVVPRRTSRIITPRRPQNMVIPSSDSRRSAARSTQAQPPPPKRKRRVLDDSETESQDATEKTSVRKKKPPRKKTNNITEPDEIDRAALGQNSDEEIERIKSTATKKRRKDAAGYDDVLDYHSPTYRTKEEEMKDPNCKQLNHTCLWCGKEDIRPISKWTSNYTWDPNTMHHFCACHKLGLVVKHGLAALGIKAPANSANKEKALGRFPVVDIMPVIEEETNDDEGLIDKLDENDEDPEHYLDELPEETPHSDSEEEDTSDHEDEEEDTRRLRKALETNVDHTRNSMALLYKNCLTVCRRMTRSATWRRIFERRMKAKGLSVRPLVAGYGIRWNADYDRQTRAYEAREVIDQILSEDLAKYHTSNRRRATDVKKVAYFHGITFDGGDWEDIKALNEELRPLVASSKGGAVG
ncbi:hypothetical protein DFH28DRAFT_1106029 [Melampsora americana]|nr:hypothetical protein DFH28DRAFT_1106029 [Melampsora americana]